jgi:hypothetical protein
MGFAHIIADAGGRAPCREGCARQRDSACCFSGIANLSMGSTTLGTAGKPRSDDAPAESRRPGLECGFFCAGGLNFNR